MSVGVAGKAQSSSISDGLRWKDLSSEGQRRRIDGYAPGSSQRSYCLSASNPAHVQESMSYTVYGLSLSVESNHSATPLVNPIRSSSCALVNRNTVLTFSFNRMLVSFFDNLRTLHAISASCFLVSSREAAVRLGLLAPSPSSSPSSPMFFKSNELPYFLSWRCFSSSLCTEHATSLLFSAFCWATFDAAREGIDDLRRGLGES